MIISKSLKYFQDKASIDKAVHKKTAYKIQFYNDKLMDNAVKNFGTEKPTKPTTAQIQKELTILNKPEVIKGYNRIINSKYTSNDNFHKMLVNNKANKQLDMVVQAEVNRINKNLSYFENILKNYEVPKSAYTEAVAKQKANLSRHEILKNVTAKANGLSAEGLNINPNVFSYQNIETTAQSLLRQSQMMSGHEEKIAINQNYEADGKEAPYKQKQWIHTHGGATTRHMSNHMQTVPFDEPFVVVNDNTLEIDLMDYPCDPAGSPSNSYICYCEVEYLTADYEPITDVLGLNDTKFEVSNPNVFDTPTPAVTSDVPKVTFLPNVEGLFDSKPKGEFIDTTDLYKTSDPLTDKTMYLLDETDDAFINEKGNWEYKGLEADKPLSDNTGGYWYEESIAKHNYQFNDGNAGEVKPSEVLSEPVENKALNNETQFNEPIDMDNLIDSPTGNYLIMEEHLTKNPITNKYEINGLEVEYVESEGLSYGKIAKEKVDEYNKQFDQEIIKEHIGYDATKNLEFDTDLDAYLINAYDNVNLVKNNGKYYYKGLEVVGYNETTKSGFISKNSILEHNQSLTGETTPQPLEVKNDYIDTSKLSELDEESWHIDGYDPAIKKDMQFNESTGKWEWNGITVEGSTEDNFFGWIDKDVIDKHNNNLSKPVDKTKKLIPEEDVIYSEEDGGYLIDTYKFEHDETNGKYYFNGLEVDNVNAGSTYTLVPKEKLDKHNQAIKSTDGLTFLESKVHNQSKILKLAEDSEDNRFAVDENGRKWAIDNKFKLEEHQDHLQNQVDMSAEYNAVESWGGGGYLQINHFNYLKRTFEDAIYEKIHKDVMPLLNEHRRAVDRGKSTTAINEKLNKVIDKYKNNRSYNIYDRVFKVIEQIKDIDTAMAKAPVLQQDTCLLRAGAWKLEFNKIGEIFEWEGFAGTSYKERPVNLGHESLSYNITILAPKGTRGVRLSKQFDAITVEREWLLPRGQKFRVLEFDEDAHTCTIELIPEDF